MKAKDIKKDDIFLVSPGRSVLTAKRGMAHAGGKITIADVDAETMEGFVDTGRVEVDKESFDAKVKAAAAEKERIAQAVKDGKARGIEAAKVEVAKVEAAKVEAAKVEAAKVEAAKVEAAKVVPATEAEIIGAIGKLEEGNSEHWTNGGAPQVAAIETLIGKQISAADRDAAWSAMQGNN